MIQFKKAAKQDIPLIQNLAEASWLNAYGEILSSEQIKFMLDTMYSEEEISAHLGNPNYHYYIIDYGVASVGFLGFETHYEHLTTKLHRIYLIPEAKGKGIGKRAMDFLKENVTMAGDSRVILAVNKANPAKIFYESQGFSVYEEGIFDIGKGFVMDDFLMEYLF
ncbi:GNAT family N-acetyltransferase [Chryseobacterium sp.]|uniref:GNAT family N-acetyltransferase n=1 Tax=Chryseobacterium sp. TaxID=1871047 RepID=UPI0011CC3969|nr:GNAT family N-acetyltransferase [Chryseobacterium sp.]TXF75120.1 GNAT family N-acetyltransferase [Chryseobacterium sp.]